MNNLFSKLLFFLNPKDELSGEWHTEDGTGFSMIMGSWIEFKPNGEGKYESWSNSEEDDGYSYNGEIIWQHIGENKIEITKIGESKKETIIYKLKKINNRLELSNLNKKKVGSIEVDGFWHFSQVMFKLK
ncbi:MAG: hypothetical protein ABI426_03580 [Flavobacterium sp.]